MNKSIRGVISYILLILLIVGIWFFVESNQTEVSSYNISMLQTELKDKNIASIDIRPSANVPTGSVVLVRNSGAKTTFNVFDIAEVEKLLKENDFSAYVVEAVPAESWLMKLLPLLLLFGAMFILFMIFSGGGPANGSNRMLDFTKSRAKMQEGVKEYNFSRVAGLKEEREDLEEIVDFLKNPEKYTALGARIPKGVLLVGPPGTGKTLLAKAIAGEADVPFFSISGSDFVEMFVGVGASRVRDLFEEAKKNAPCIVFIDEIDAVARRRGTGMGGGHDEREQTLNQMLVEMDGFGTNAGIIVLAATNRVDILDPAIMRPGRFDRKIAVGRPDIGGRREILAVHAKDKPLGDDVDLENIARTTAGFTGADLENLLNESAILAAKSNRKFICQNDIRQSFVKVGIGQEKRSKVISDEDKKITAYHEAGHAILFHVLPDVGPVYSISIIPTGIGAAGYTMPLPEKDEVHMTKTKLLHHIMVSMGGRIAEELIFGDVTTGASQDIKDASAHARDMIARFGMSESLGFVCYDPDEEIFIGRDIGHAKNFSEDTAARIDEEVRKLMDDCYKKAKEIVSAHTDILHKTADLLLEKEKITREEFEALFE